MRNRKAFSSLAARAALALVAAVAAAGTGRAQNGTIEFVVRVTPASGQSEPVRKQTIHLLRKSFRDIQKEAETLEAQPDLAKFVDKLDLTLELKAWMKRTHSTVLAGDDFHKKLTPDDVLNITEFMNAYLAVNLTGGDLGLPKPKFREKDKTAHPAKYEKLHKEYFDALRKYIEKNPQSVETMDTQLMEWDPSAKWERELAMWRQAVHERALVLAQTRELAAKTETDMQGRGAFEAVPGNYWLSTLDAEAIAGEARLRWDVEVIVVPSRITRVELSNINALRRSTAGGVGGRSGRSAAHRWLRAAANAATFGAATQKLHSP